MIEKCEDTNRAAGKPATAPTAAETTGTVAIARPIDSKRGVANTGSPWETWRAPEAPDAAPDAPAMLPPPPSRNRTNGSRYRQASSSA